MTQPPDDLPGYRVLTGPDDTVFCRRVSEAIALGYELYGSPAATFDGASSTLIRNSTGGLVGKYVEGVRNPSVLRGRVLSRFSIQRSSSLVMVLKSMLRDRYWRASPLAFSLLPRCQAEYGSAK